MGVSRYDDSDRLQFLIDRPQLTVLREEAIALWSVYDLEARKPVSRWHDSARAALDDAIEHQQFVQGGLRAP